MRKTTLITTLGLTLAMACSQITPETANPGLVRQDFIASLGNDADTRTSLSGSNVLWDASGESIDIINQNGTIYTAGQTGVSDDRRTASFAGEVPESGNLYAVYPSGFCSGWSDGLIDVTLPSVQTPVADGFATHSSPTVAEIGSGGKLDMRNVCGMVGITVNCSNISSVCFSAKESNGGSLTGAARLQVTDGIPVVASASNGTGQVELKGSIQSGAQYWALVYPGTYTGLKMVFTDANGRTATFTKDATFTVNRSKARRISAFTITETDWDDYQPADGPFTLVTSPSELKSGDQVLIVYTDGKKALGALNSSGNFRDPVDITISGNTISSPGNATVLSLETGTSSGTWAFKDGTNYLASVSSGNYLKNSPDKTDNASWGVSIANGLATVQAKAGGSTYLSYNSTNPRFACYKNTDQKAVSLYRRGNSSAPATPTVTTQSATNVGMADATLNASFSGIPTNPDPTAAFFRWGTSSTALNGEVYDNQTLLDKSSGSFSASLTGLQEGTTYYFKAVMTLANGTDVEGEVMSFTTRSAQQSNAPGYLACYEVPAVEVSGSVTSGNETHGYKWYKYYTTNSKRAVATHTVQYNNKVIRNYTVMMDADKKSPVWCATAFNTGTWPDNNVGRTGSWKSDPAFPTSWQQTNDTGPYGKGHLIASNYRQTSGETNKQTFYLSNQAAQYQTRFNDGIWNTLEQKVANAAPSGRDTMYVVVGILYEGTTTVTDGIYIPSHFYKCIMKCSFDAGGSMTAATGCAYLFENREYSATNYSAYKTTIDAIEQRTGLDFFHNVPDDLENAAESVAGSPF